jgi:hypothetical protein
MYFFHYLKHLFSMVMVFQLSSCLSTGLTEVDSDPDFDWNSLKRDKIVMMPVIDLRKNPMAPHGHESALTFFTEAECLSYPEAFKQVFFKLRKDIRVFGAGGAFEKLSKLANIHALTEHALDKTPLRETDVASVNEVKQRIRYVFFFAITGENLHYDFEYNFRTDHATDLKSYMSVRDLTVRLALWDSTTNRTVWRGTDHLNPTNINSVEVSNPTKKKKVDGDRVVWTGTAEDTNLAIELDRQPQRFPGFPSREPSFTNSFDDFALALPLNPSEAKLIEYTHFVYHRPEIGLRLSAYGNKPAEAVQLGTSSVINYTLRFGAAVVISVGQTVVKHQSHDYRLSSSSFGVTFDYEWLVSPKMRLLTGMMAGSTQFVISEQTADATVATQPAGLRDSALFFWPRAFLLFGEKGGIQYGLGATARFFDGVENPVLKANRPSPWGLDLSVAYAIRGW